jgi:molecular chaperone DnaK (HSP70)
MRLFIHLLFLIKTVSSNVIGIDLGSDSFKVAIVQPGTPLDIGKFHYISNIVFNSN